MTDRFVYFESSLGVLICKTCEFAVMKESLLQHFRKIHSVEKNLAIEMEKELLAEEAQCKGMKNDILIDQYIIAPRDTTRQEVCKPLPFLPIKSCVKCRKCNFIAHAMKTYQNHAKTCGSDAKIFDKVFAQTIFGGKNTLYYQVSPEGAEEEEKKWFTAKFRECLFPNRSANVVPNRESERSGFLSLLRFDEFLKVRCLSYSVAYAFTQMHRASIPKCILKLVGVYLDGVYTISKTVPYIRSHTFMDQSLHIQLQPDTLERYSTAVATLVQFLCLYTGKTNLELPNTFRLSTNDDLREKLCTLFCSSDVDATEGNLLALHDIFMQICFWPMNETCDEIPAFIACSAIRKEARHLPDNDEGNFRFASSTEMTPLLAALKYLLKCVCVSQIYKYSSAEDRISQWEQLNSYVSENSDCGATYIAFCKKTCDQDGSWHIGKEKFSVCTEHDLCGSVEGNELSVLQLTDGIKELQKQSWELIHKHLLFGMSLERQFWDDCAKLQDQFGNRTTGYWFSMHPANKPILDDWSRKYLQHAALSKTVGGNDVDRHCGLQFLNVSWEVCMNLYTLMQLTSGGPARATEMQSFLVCNTPSAMRNVYIDNGKLFYVLSYDKGREKRNGREKHIPRFPDSATAALLLVYLLFVKPMTQVVTSALHLEPDDCTVDRLTSSVGLFSRNGVIVNAQELRDKFSTSLRKVGINLSTLQYRHYHVGVMKNFLAQSTFRNQNSRSSEWSLADIIDVLHQQAGHSVATAQEVYGISSTDMQNVSSVELGKFKAASMMWHQFLSLSSLPCFSYGTPSLNRNALDAHPQSDTLPNGDIENVLARLTEKIDRLEQQNLALKDSIDLLLRKVCNEDESGLARKRPLSSSNLDPSVNNGQSAPVRRKLFHGASETLSRDEVLILIQRFLGLEGEANFKSEKHEDAIMHCLAPTASDALIVLPTGAGKSLAFMIPAFKYPDKVCLLVVPLIALQQDIILRCNRGGVDAVEWKDRHTAGARVVVVSAEHVVRADYQTFVKELHCSKKLFAIFVDEAHLFVQWTNFRPVLLQVQQCIRPDGVDRPIFGLTATAPPNMANQIALHSGMDTKNVTFIRDSTSRGNISYNVKFVNQDEEMNETSSELRRFAKGDITKKVLEKSDCFAIVYCKSRQVCDALELVCSVLSKAIFKVSKYHAGMSLEDRRQAFEKWSSPSQGQRYECRVMICTAAFGCGIDIGNVMLVVHVGIPYSILSFVQESGRCGRNGEPAESLIIATNEECERLCGESSKRVDENDNSERTTGSDTRNSELDADFIPNEKDTTNEFGSLQSWVVGNGRKNCRRWLLDAFLDEPAGSVGRLTCTERGMVQCDICRIESDETCMGNSSAAKVPGQQCDNLFSTPPPQPCSQLNMGGMTVPVLSFGETTSPALTGRLQQRQRLRDNLEQPPWQTQVGTSIRTPSTFRCMGTPTQRTSSQRSVHVSGLKELCNRFNEVCAVCTISRRRDVRHFSSDQNRACYANRCLRCGLTGHNLETCWLVQLGTNERGSCYQCKLSLHRNQRIHGQGEMGSRRCKVINSLRLLILAWSKTDLRAQLTEIFPEMSTFNSEIDFVQWLRQTGEDHNVNFATVLPTFADSCLNN